MDTHTHFYKMIVALKIPNQDEFFIPFSFLFTYVQVPADSDLSL